MLSTSTLSTFVRKPYKDPSDTDIPDRGTRPNRSALLDQELTDLRFGMSKHVHDVEEALPVHPYRRSLLNG